MSKKFIRWQYYAMSQLTIVLNMFFGLSVGALAFLFSLLRDEEFILKSCFKLAFQIGIICLCISVLISIVAVISRLFDYRFTAQNIRTNEKKEIEESSVYKYKSSLLGSFTWRLFWIQVIILSLGLIGSGIGVLSAYSDRIW